MLLVYADTATRVTPEVVAELFASMDSAEQARFFNHVGEVSSKWGKSGGSLYIQLQYVTDDDGLTLAGRRVMDAIGEYSHWGLCYNFLADVSDSVEAMGK